VKLFEDSLEFQVSDFECLRSNYHRKGWEEYYGPNPDDFFTGFAERMAKQYTEAINHRLSFFAKGNRIRLGKKPNTGKRNAAIVFEYLWRRGVNNHHGDPAPFFNWIPLSELSKNLVRYRKLGRPEGGKAPVRYIDNEGNPIPHRTELIRILNRLEDVELIEVNRETINKDRLPDKQKENVFYRISDRSIDSSVTTEEKYVVLKNEYEQLSRMYAKTQDNFTHAYGVIEDLGFDPLDAIDRHKKAYEKYLGDLIQSRKRKSIGPSLS
jgi:hypothetical protein